MRHLQSVLDKTGHDEIGLEVSTWPETGGWGVYLQTRGAGPRETWGHVSGVPMIMETVSSMLCPPWKYAQRKGQTAR